MKKKIFYWVMTAIVCGTTVFTACTSKEDNGGTKVDDHAKKALLIILDGWGIGMHRGTGTLCTLVFLTFWERAAP